MSPEQVCAIIARQALFSQLAAEQQQEIAYASRIKNLTRGQALFHAGDRLPGFFIVLSGQIKLTITSHKGIEKVLDLVTPGRSFGEALVFMNANSPVSALAVEETCLAMVPREHVVSLIEESRDFVFAMLAGLSRRLHNLVVDVEAYCLQSSTQRVVGFLISEAERQEPASSSYAIQLPANKNLIASRLNLTPESFSRCLHQLSQAKIINVINRNIQIHDVEQLRQYGGQFATS